MVNFKRYLNTSRRISHEKDDYPVYEAVYAKVLGADGEMLRPQTRNLTQKTRSAFCQLFPLQMLASECDATG